MRGWVPRVATLAAPLALALMATLPGLVALLPLDHTRAGRSAMAGETR
jgi:hypothetical protein